MTMNEIHDKVNNAPIVVDYSKNTYYNVEELIKAATKYTAVPVVATMGANGSYHLFNKATAFSQDEPTITNDGVTVAESIFPTSDKVTNTVASYILGAANKTATIAGDGTTRTIATIDFLTQTLVGACKNPYTVQEGIDLAIKKCLQHIEKSKKSITLKDIYKIAYTSSHGNKEVAKNIRDIYKELKGKWNVEVTFESGDFEDYMSIKEGYSIKGKSASLTTKVPPKLHDCRVILFNDVLTDPGIILKNVAIRKQRDSSPVIFIVKEANEQAVALIKKSSSDYSIPMYVVKVDTFGGEVQKQFEDLAYLFSVEYIEEGDCYSAPNFEAILDNAAKMRIENIPHIENSPSRPWYELAVKSVLLTNEESIFETTLPTEVIEYYVNEIKQNVPEDKVQIKLQEKRIKRIRSTNVTYYVGGNSPQDIATKKYLVEDALLAVKSAIKKGVLPGAGWYDINLANHLESTKHELEGEVLVGYQAIIDALQYGLKIMCESGYQDFETIKNNYLKEKKLFNFQSFEYEDLEESNIKDSACTLLEVLRNSQSVINHFLKTKTLTV